MLRSATAAIRISSATAMPKIFNPIDKRMAPPPSGEGPRPKKRSPTRQNTRVDYTLPKYEAEEGFNRIRSTG
jgi:hypothetical protein